MLTVARPDQIKTTDIELWGMYNVLRSSYLNVLYYGQMAAKWSARNLWLQIGASIGTLSAVTGFLASQTSVAGEHELGWRIVSAIVGAVSGLCAALPALMGLSHKISKCERLHFSYCELFHLTQRATMDVRREGIISVEQIGVAKLLGDLYSRLGQADDTGIDANLRDKCEREVREKYPPDSLWYASGNGNQTTEPAKAAPTTT